MAPRPLIKWKSFWLGILVLGFLGWAWVRSMARYDGLFWYSVGGTITGASNSGGLLHLVIETPGARLPANPGINVVSRTLAARDWWPRAFQNTSVAHWFLMLLFLVPWISFLAWRVRKQRKPNA